MKPRRFVIPDIHGCCRTFRSLVSEVIRLARADELYLLGDMIDCGPEKAWVWYQDGKCGTFPYL